MLQMTDLIKSRMVSIIEQVDDENINPTFKASVITGKGDICIVYCKKINARERFIECICALIGRELGLPIPQPYLVLVSNEFDSTIPPGHYNIYFGSEDAEYPSLRRRFNASSEEKQRELLNILRKELLKFSKSLDVAAFDEWIANNDRNIGNMLYDGQSRFIFIDHGMSLPVGLMPTQPAQNNLLMNWLYADQNESQKQAIRRSCCGNILPDYNKLDIMTICHNTNFDKSLSADEVNILVDFLTSRVVCLDNLVTQRLKLSQPDLYS